MALRTISNSVVAIALGLAGAGALAQTAPDRLRFETSEAGTQATVTSVGKIIRIGVPTEVLQKGLLLDLDADGVTDAALEVLWDDGSSFHLWLRRSGGFIEAAKIEDIATDVVYGDVDGNRTLEVLVPGPDADKVFNAFMLFEGRYQTPHDEIRVLGYRDNKYVPLEIACLTGLSREYLGALDTIEAGVPVNDPRFKLSPSKRPALAAVIAKWRARLTGGCPTS